MDLFIDKKVTDIEREYIFKMPMAFGFHFPDQY